MPTVVEMFGLTEETIKVIIDILRFSLQGRLEDIVFIRHQAKTTDASGKEVSLIKIAGDTDKEMIAYIVKVLSGLENIEILPP